MTASIRVLLLLILASFSCGKSGDGYAKKKEKFFKDNEQTLAGLVVAIETIAKDADARPPLASEDGTPPARLDFSSRTSRTTNARFVNQESLRGVAFKTVVPLQKENWLRDLLKHGKKERVTDWNGLKVGFQLEYLLVVREGVAQAGQIEDGALAHSFSAGHVVGDVLAYAMPSGAYVGGLPFAAANSETVKTLADNPETGLRSNLSLQAQKAIVEKVGGWAKDVTYPPNLRSLRVPPASR